MFFTDIPFDCVYVYRKDTETNKQTKQHKHHDAFNVTATNLNVTCKQNTIDQLYSYNIHVDLCADRE